MSLSADGGEDVVGDGDRGRKPWDQDRVFQIRPIQLRQLHEILETKGMADDVQILRVQVQPRHQLSGRAVRNFALELDAHRFAKPAATNARLHRLAKRRRFDLGQLHLGVADQPKEKTSRISTPG